MSFSYPDEPSFWTDYATAVAELYAEAGEPFIGADLARYFWFTRAGHSSAGMSPEQAKAKHLAELREALGLTPPVVIVGPAGDLLPVRVERARFRTDTGWIVPFFYTALHLVYEVKTGNVAEAERLLNRSQQARRNGVRFSGMLGWSTHSFSPRDPGYWEWLDTTVNLAAARGQYSEIAFFCDAQIVVPDHAERLAWVRKFAEFCTSHPTIWAQIANEPYKNGWGKADDPQLLELAKEFKRIAPNIIMSVGDAQDNFPAYIGTQKALAKLADYLVIHADRKGVAGNRFRWVDHLDGWWDNRREWPGLAAFHDEKMGAAAVYDGGRRDNSVVAHVAGSVVACMVGGDNYMHRSTENDACPGLLESAFAADIPGSPDWKYINATLAGSPVADFTPKDGPKVRTITNGREAWICAYGESPVTVAMASGWTLGESKCDRTDSAGTVRVWTATR